ncbi:MAG: DUF6503 family protein [Ekhidna sp.]|uniref:DUF6503 family protein n=1 Tax=Ekhidna sp. TaxID=2608089 RepID=UPI0032F0923B
MKNLTSLALVFALVACQPSKQTEEKQPEVPAYKAPEHHSASLTNVFDAHGGYEQWSKMKLLSYEKGGESTIVNLQNRKIRLESPQQTIGFDGDDVWVTPDTVDASRARFYHNLFFYFYTMPFVVGDPGAYYEDVEPRELSGKAYNGIKISYGENIGDAPDDNYILWFDPETNKMEWLMYTVTYGSGEPSDSYHLIKYEDWTEFNGLLLPASLQWFQYDGDSVGDPRGEATLFENIEISEEAPSDSLFVMPENAQIAPLNAGE